MTGERYCINCEHYRHGKCRPKKVVIRKITIPDNYEQRGYSYNVYKEYNPSKKNKHNNCTDYEEEEVDYYFRGHI